MTFEKKIFAGALGFVLFLFFLVFSCFKQEFHLVSEDYYRQEIAYQSHIEKQQNSRLLEHPVIITHDANNKSIQVKFPISSIAINKDELQGNIVFYRHSNSAMDVLTPIKLNEDLAQKIDVSELQKGLWKVKIDWQNKKKQFYDEFNLIVP